MRKNTRSEVGPKTDKDRGGALSTSSKTDRHAAIDMRTTTDVSTASCVEMSKQILTRPEVNLGSMLNVIAASKRDVNKSDAVIVITAAILETIGNKRAAEVILGKSRTVSKFYSSMRLSEPTLRDSFVIMLFALAPEFVKSVESAVRTSLKRVEDSTDAPNSEARLAMTQGELLRDGSISLIEHNANMREIFRATPEASSASRPNSFTLTPEDMVAADDSASNLGRAVELGSDGKVSTLGLLRYIKTSKAHERRDFSRANPLIPAPVELANNTGRTGLGFRQVPSAVTGARTDDTFCDAINELLPSRLTLRPARKLRPTIDTRAATSTRWGIVTDSGAKKTFAEEMGLPPEPNADPGLEVTREDIEEKMAESRPNVALASHVETDLTVPLTAEELMDLLY
jgi:hypothetical protein